MKKNLRKLGFGAVAFLASASAFAAVPVGVTTAIGDMSADAVTVATAVLVAIIAVVAIKFIRKGL